MNSSKTIHFTILLLVAVTTATGDHRVVRQASSSCGRGTQCIPLSSCPSLQSLTRNPSEANLRRIRDVICDVRRGSLKVCCGSQSTPIPRSPPSTPKGEGLLPEQCGLSATGERIFLGHNAPLGGYPWMAVLGYRTILNRELEWKCGGALINERYIITAAHCVSSDLPLEEIRLGEHNLDTNPDCSNTTSGSFCAPRHQAFKVTSRAQIISHPDYNTRTPISDDIALIRLDRKATLDNFVHPICLPGAGLNPKSFLGSKQATVAGWGRTEGGENSRVLKRTFIPFVDLESCRPFYPVRLNDDQICLGSHNNRRDSCTGDSGGPVFQQDNFGINYMIGIVSFGRNCGETPAIYTNVVSYRTWIVQNLRP